MWCPKSLLAWGLIPPLALFVWHSSRLVWLRTINGRLDHIIGLTLDRSRHHFHRVRLLKSNGEVKPGPAGQNDKPEGVSHLFCLHVSGQLAIIVAHSARDWWSALINSNKIVENSSNLENIPHHLVSRMTTPSHPWLHVSTHSCYFQKKKKSRKIECCSECTVTASIC